MQSQTLSETVPASQTSANMFPKCSKGCSLRTLAAWHIPENNNFPKPTGLHHSMCFTSSQWQFSMTQPKTGFLDMSPQSLLAVPCSATHGEHKPHPGSKFIRFYPILQWVLSLTPSHFTPTHANNHKNAKQKIEHRTSFQLELLDHFFSLPLSVYIRGTIYIIIYIQYIYIYMYTVYTVI